MTMDLLVVAKEDGTMEIYAPGQLPFGAMIKNPQQLNISGPSHIFPPTGPQTVQEVERWLDNLKASGFTIIRK